MPSQFEEVVAQANLLQVQHLRPDRRDLLFQFTLRRHIGTLRLRGIHGRQGLAVELAIGRQRQAVQCQPLVRHHVVRQAAA